jgi:hypothetical protein
MGADSCDVIYAFLHAGRFLYKNHVDGLRPVRYAGVADIGCTHKLMLKIGSVRWRGKCTKHPGFDPATEGPGAIRGNCQRCSDLMVIHDLHQKTLRLMRTFRPAEEKKTAPKTDAADDRQMGLFV